jgi:hypothetical protein
VGENIRAPGAATPAAEGFGVDRLSCRALRPALDEGRGFGVGGGQGSGEFVGLTLALAVSSSLVIVVDLGVCDCAGTAMRIDWHFVQRWHG